MTETRVTLGHDAIQLIQDTAVRASRAVIDEVEGAPDHVRYVRGRDGTCAPMELDPHPRDHGLRTFGSLIEFAKNATLAPDAEPDDTPRMHGGKDVVVWCGDDRVDVVLDDRTRRDAASLRLGHTPQWVTLKEIGTNWYCQREFVRLLRVELADCLERGHGLLGLIRNLKFKAATENAADLQQGKESLGKSLNAEVLGTDVIPEMVTMCVRIFDVPDRRAVAHITCAIEIDLRNQAFQLIPLPMQMEDAIAEELADIFAMLTDQLPCPVYRGTCSPKS